MSYCGLDSTTKDQLPEIWTLLQSTKDWFDASTEFVKWFRIHQSPCDIEFTFHKELVDDLRKLMFSFGPAPLADNAHRGVTILSFVLMSVAEENDLREEQEYRDEATHITPNAVKASRRKCPPIPTTFDSFERLLSRYIHALLILFGTS